jgi:hypothetical protein
MFRMKLYVIMICTFYVMYFFLRNLKQFCLRLCKVVVVVNWLKIKFARQPSCCLPSLNLVEIHRIVLEM